MPELVSEEEEQIFKIEQDESESYSDEDLYNINSWGADLSFRELITMYEEEELLKPELQRNYVWDKSEASRFIESLLMGLPVPSIFLAKIEEEKKLIIDGYQRIMTVYDYVNTGIFSGDKKVFKLSNSSAINEKWRGKAFNELNTDEQRRIRSTTIHAIIFEQRHPKNDDTSMYQIFERINTSGRTLMPQEIRNCVYQGNFNKLLFELNNLKCWRVLSGDVNPDPRMRDMEFILRFFALHSENIKDYTATAISLKKHLNLYMGNKKHNVNKYLDERQKIFVNTMNFIWKYMGESAFHNISFKSNKIITIKRFHPTIFDAIAISTSYALKETPNIELTDFQDKKIKMLSDPNFIKYISERTTNLENIHGRISLALKYLYGLDYEKINK